MTSPRLRASSRRASWSRDTHAMNLGRVQPEPTGRDTHAYELAMMQAGELTMRLACLLSASSFSQ